MKIENIKFPTPLTEIKDINNDNIDVFVETDDGMIYTFVVTTPQNYYWYMDKEGLDFIPAGHPNIIVKNITEENIRGALETYLENNGYWLKLYYLAGKGNGIFDLKSMDEMIDDIKKTNKEIFG